MRRIVSLMAALAVFAGFSFGGRLIAQDEKKDAGKQESKPEAKPEQKPADTAKPGEGGADAKQADKSAEKGTDKSAEKATAEPVVPPPLKPVPPEVEAKLEAARRAVAEAIVAAQDAGLVDTTIDPPPILDILILGQANDKAVLKAKLDELKANPNASPEARLSVEVFGAWFSGHGAMEGVDLQKNIRIIAPSQGLVDWYAKRADLLKRHIDEVRKSKPAATPEPAKDAAPAAETKAETKNEEAKPAEDKKDETKPAEESKPAGDAKPEEEKKGGL